ncbi:metallopeptidase family protein [uncultured Corynebacterium sp.]|uniref:metallopeptidase family protein n=1 Tax=uncultured Corynebacterium sp. TaxID=159447 RepID=UPI0025936DC6|nr:metallopeptidase family protein [uncultured Corynebacterium sp.]
MGHITRVRNDRHGRGPRGALLPELPRHKTRSQKFDNAVMDAYEPIAEQFESQLSSLDVAVDVVPRMRLEVGYQQWPDDVVAEGQVPLGRLVPAGVDAEGRPTRPRIIIFRRPVELRADSPEALRDQLHHMLVRLVAAYLNVTPETIDPRFTWDR